MTAIALLRELRRMGVTLAVAGGELEITAPKGTLTPQLRAQLAEHKQELISLLSPAAAGRERIPALQRAAGEPAQCAMSYAQQRLWVLHRLLPDNPFCNIPLALRLDGALDADALQASLDALVARHETLRTSFRAQGEMAVQVIAAREPVALTRLDLSALPQDEREAQARRQVQEEALRPFDLARGPLLRALLLHLGSRDHVLQLTLHHIVADGWSLPVLYRDLGVLYEAARSGQAARLPQLPIQYADFAAWQRQWLSGEVLEQQLSYWRKRLQGAGELALPTDRARPAMPSYRGARESLTLPASLSEQLTALGRRKESTLYMVLLAAFGVLLARYTGQDDVVVGSPIANRTHAQLEDLIGFFVNSLVMRIDASGDPTFVELLRRVRAVALEAYAHQDLPFERLVEELAPQRDLSRNPLFQVMFAVQNAPAKAGEAPDSGLAIDVFPIPVQTTHFDLHVDVWESPEHLRVAVCYSTDLFEAGTIRRMLEHYANVLAQAVEDPQRRIGTIELLSEPERALLLEGWNATGTGYPRDRCVHELFEAWAHQTPDAVAVEYDGQALSYGELNARANRMAHYLLRHGVGAETLVGLCLPRGLEMVVATLGILKAGGAYVPLDPEYPAARLRFMLEDTGAPVLLTQASLRERLPRYDGRVVCVDAQWEEIGRESEADPKVAVGSRNLAYVIYTSGSTGTPKGTCVEHRSIVRLVRDSDYIAITPADRFAQASVVSFDAATFELWGALLNGARAIGVGRELSLSGREFGEFLRTREITVLFLTTALFNQMAREAPGAFGSLRCLLFGGEMVDAEAVRAVLRDGAPRELLHVYGPTEVTTFSTWYRVSALAQEARTVPIGRPIANTTAYVLNGHLQPVPVGVPGELYLGGDGLARGYLKRPELTAERFVEHPFSAEAGARLYRTGDLVRRLGDGNIEFLGRQDGQVKVRGFRIELGEIEAVLLRHPAVRQAVAMVREDVPGDKRVVAYVVNEPEAPADVVEQLRAEARASLPGYMLPSIVMLDALPLTPNGKVNREALPAPAQRQQLAHDYVPPRGKIAATIAAVWAELLGIDRVGAHDNFFDLGGNSLLLVRGHERLQRELGMTFRVVELFQHPTVESLARHLAGESTQLPAVAAAQERVARRSAHPGSEAIAIVGMAGRFPGAASIDALWRNLCDGVESIRFFTPEELRAAGVGESEWRDPSYVPARGYLEDGECFDAAFFGYTPREAEMIDPQQRVFLECAASALDDAGYDPARYPGLIGVYAGSSRNSYLVQLAGMAALGDTRAAGLAPTQGDHDFLATRVSYKLDLRGPAVTVQTACSTSLVAVHEACRALVHHDCDMALAGGVSVVVPRMGGYLYQPDGIASPDGHCRAFDADAQGTVPGEGVAVVVLKRLEDALRDGDTVRAVIRGTAVNNDGSGKVGFTAPSVDGQAEVIARAQAQAGVDAGSIGYVETHGTGTALGDPIEIAALSQVFGPRRADRPVCYLGAVKSNFGHLDAAAGVTGLVKAALALQHGSLPPTLHFRAPNPRIDLAAGPFEINAELRTWETSPGIPRRAGVSSFGMGGTNAHVVLEQATEQAPAEPARSVQLLPLAGRTPTALQTMSALLAQRLEASASPAALADVAYTLQVGRRRFPERRTFVVRSTEDAIAQLRAEVPRLGCTARAGDRPAEVAFMFPGQGAQYPGMGRGLYAEQGAFRETVDSCCEQLQPLLGCDLRPLLFAAGERAAQAAAELARTALTQPALFVIEYALAQQWKAWGVHPQAMIGHSVGEYVAACLAGVMTLEDALAVVAERGRLMDALPRGAMLGVTLPESELAALLDDGISIAAVNGPELCVVSGAEGAIDALASQLQQRGLAGQRLHTSHAFHSVMMEPALGPFAERMRKLALRSPSVSYVSNVTGTWITPAEATDPDYYVRHLRATVRFSAGLEALFATPNRVLLEAGPGRALTALASRHPVRPAESEVVASLPAANGQLGDVETMLHALGVLWVNGVEPDWAAVHGHSKRRRIALPSYPFERRPYLLQVQPERLSAPANAKRPDPAAWFYQPSWKRTGPLDPGDGAPAGRWLVFLDASGVGKAIADALSRCGSRVVCVHESPAFEELGPTAFGLCPNDETHYARLIERLRQEDALPDRIAHLWMVGGEDVGVARARDAGFFSITHLVRALAAAGATDGAALLVLTDSWHDVLGHERISPSKALVLGPCQVIEAEYPGMRCRAIDVDTADPAFDAERIASALAFDAADPKRDPVLAYRGAYRWSQSAEPSPIGEPEPSRMRLRESGCYLITGGLGGMGLAFAAHLARVARARLVLVGRTALPAPETWDELLRTAAAEDPLRMKIEALRAMQAAGAEVMACAADVSDRAAMAAVLAAARRRFGRIHGAIHAAGIPGGAILERQTRATVDPVFAPKVLGTQILDELLAEDRPDFLLLCSSLITCLGLPGRSEYTSANAYVDAYARAQAQRGRREVVAVNWDTWTESGMAVGNARPAVERSDGMSDAEGVDVLRRVFASAHSQVIVSVREFRPRVLEALYARHAATSDAATTEDRAPAARSRYPRPPLKNAFKAPRSAAEKVLIEIWQDLLGIDALGVDDNFFELGGDSVLGLRIVARARKAGLELRAKQIFEHQTVAELAAAVAAAPAPDEARPVTGEVPLMPIQCWFFEQRFTHPNFFNQSLLLKVPGSLDPQQLAAALVDLVARHDALRCRFRYDGASWRQQVAAAEVDVPLRVVNVREQGEADRARELTARCSELAAQLDLEAGPLVRAGYFILDGGRDGRLALIVHHLVVDAVSWPILIEDLQAAYVQQGNGGARLGAPTTSFQECARRLTEYAHTATQADELFHWRLQARRPLRPLPVEASAGENSVGSTASIFASLTPAETRALTVEVHEVYRTRITDLLLAALWQTFAGWSGESRIGIALEGHGRDLPLEGIDLSRTVGWFTSMYPLYLEGSPNGGLDELVPRIKEQLAAVPRSGTGFGILRYLCPKAEVRSELAALPQPEIAFLYLGQLDAVYRDEGGWTPAAESVGEQRDPRILRSHLFELKVAIQDGRLVTDWIYSHNRHREGTVQGLVDSFLDALRALIAHCREAAARGQSAPRFSAARLTRRDLDAIRMQLQARGGGRS